MSQHVFLTGASGYLGSAVLDELLATGYRVTAPARSAESAERLRARGAGTVPGDLTEPDSLSAAAGSADAVIHLAQPRLAPGDDLAAAMATIGGRQLGAVKALLAGSRPGTRVVATSGTGGYGERGDEIVDEHTPTTVDHPMTADLKAAERLLLTSDRVRGAVVRPGIVYGGAGGPLTMVAARAEQAGTAYWLGEGGSWLTLVHRDDVAALYRLVLESDDATGLYNAVSTPFVTQRELVETIGKAVGVPAGPAPAAVAGQLAAGPGVLNHSAKVVTSRASELGWRPRPIDLAEVAREVVDRGAFRP